MCLIMTDRGWRNLSDGKVCVNHNQLEGVYRNIPSEHAAMITSARADKYADAITKYVNGYHSRDDMYRQIANLGDLHGAYGERL